MDLRGVMALRCLSEIVSRGELGYQRNSIF